LRDVGAGLRGGAFLGISFAGFFSAAIKRSIARRPRDGSPRYSINEEMGEAMKTYARPAIIVVLATLGAQGGVGTAAAQTGEAKSGYPSDVHADSGNRLPLPKREDLDPASQKTFDSLSSPSGGSLAGLRGPGGILLYSPKLSELNSGLNRYLRGPEAGWSGHVRELAILVVAREFDSQFEWAAHESVAVKEGVPAQTIDVVKHRKSLRGVPEADAVVIELGREIYRSKKVSAATYARAVKQFGAPGLINLVGLMGNYAGTAVLLATFDMQLSPGQKPLLPMP
jgi:4-carboxymuconolactone decarboxylase